MASYPSSLTLRGLQLKIENLSENYTIVVSLFLLQLNNINKIEKQNLINISVFGYPKVAPTQLEYPVKNMIIWSYY